MHIQQLTLDGIRCFSEKQTVDTSKSINIFLGHNNAGKSTILKAIYHLQGHQFVGTDISIDRTDGQIEIKLDTNSIYRFNHFPTNPYDIETVRDVNVIFSLNQRDKYEINSRIEMIDNLSGALLKVIFDPYLKVKNRNLIYPYFSNRKPSSYLKSVKKIDADRIEEGLNNLYAKIDFLTANDRPSSIQYREACMNIIGFYIGTEQDDDGKYAAFTVDESRSIAITSMGDGIPNILGLIVDLCLARDNIFLIEELENDIHPKALKALLKLIDQKSENNQFFISTHSNIVVRQLGANPCTNIFQVVVDETPADLIKIPKSRIEQIPDEPEARLKILEDLGCDVSDYALWKGWLFLEESSAESIINNILIPNFASTLTGKLKTFSAGGFNKIGNKFMNFSNLFIYAHLGSLYQNRAWVVIDAGDNEKSEIDNLIKYFPSWD